jgi:hypothetical protein
MVVSHTLYNPLNTDALATYPTTLPPDNPTIHLLFQGIPMKPLVGTLHTHFFLDGLFIVTYHSDKRIGLKSIDTGTMRYIDHRLFESQYTPLSSDVSDK